MCKLFWETNLNLWRKIELDNEKSVFLLFPTFCLIRKKNLCPFHFGHILHFRVYFVFHSNYIRLQIHKNVFKNLLKLVIKELVKIVQQFIFWISFQFNSLTLDAYFIERVLKRKRIGSFCFVLFSKIEEITKDMLLITKDLKTRNFFCQLMVLFCKREWLICETKKYNELNSIYLLRCEKMNWSKHFRMRKSNQPLS